MKKVKIMNYVTAGMSVFYAIVSFPVFVIILQANKEIADSVNRTEALAQQLPRIFPMLLLNMMLWTAVLLALGITVLILAVSLPKHSPGRRFSILYASLTIGGFVFGILPFISTACVLSSAIGHIMAGRQIGKATPEPSANKTS